MTNNTLLLCIVTLVVTIPLYQSAKKTKREIWNLAKKEGKTDKILFQAMNNPDAPFSDILSFVVVLGMSALLVFLIVPQFLPKKDPVLDQELQRIKQEIQTQPLGQNKQQETQTQTSGQKQPSNKPRQNQKMPDIVKETGLSFSNLTYEELPNYDGQGHLRVVIRCMAENVTNRKVYLSYSDLYLRKENENTFEAKWGSSGVTKDLNENKTGAKNLADFSNHMDLFPNDRVAIVCTYDTSIKGNSASGCALYKNNMASDFSENLVFISKIP